ncbi:hypothetical protein ACO9S2_14835 [Nitrospira sp. NS4]|uniref:hypothetical protein n=1 Tax=Nitrospira sp. NS4 TaxID=3414498 RepID=UPI003C2BFBEF
MAEPGSDLPMFLVPHILLVEDSPGEAELFCQALQLNWDGRNPRGRMLCPRIDLVQSGQGALGLLREQAEMNPPALPAFVVLDLDLPGGSGVMLLRELRQDTRFSDLPVIGLLWAEDEALMRSLDGLGLLAHEVKPVFFADLLTLVGRFCHHFYPITPRLEFSGGERGPHP